MSVLYVNCAGRLSNHLLRMAGIVAYLDNKGIKNKLVAVQYQQLNDNRIILPDNVVFVGSAPRNTKSVTIDEINDLSQDCIVEESREFMGVTQESTIVDVIRKIRLSKEFNKELSALINERTVGIHVRYGDYVVSGGPFLRASEHYYTTSMDSCLDDGASDFFLATDGTDEEVRYITSRYNIIPGRRDDPVFDLFALSKCKTIIGSMSTFTSVAAYYGGARLIVPKTNEQ